MAKLTPLKAIRAKCIDCSAGSYKEIAECPIYDCPLYCYRFGKRPAKSQTQNSERSNSDEK